MFVSTRPAIPDPAAISKSMVSPGASADPALTPAGGMALIIGPAGPVLTLRRGGARVQPSADMFHRLSEAEAARVHAELGAWLARRDAPGPG